MIERLPSSDRFEQMKKVTIELLQDVKARSAKPSLFDRVALLVDRPVAEGLARMWGINPDEVQ